MQWSAMTASPQTAFLESGDSTFASRPPDFSADADSRIHAVPALQRASGSARQKCGCGQVPRMPRRQDQRKVRAFGDCDGLPELPRGPRQQRHHPRSSSSPRLRRRCASPVMRTKMRPRIKGTVHPPAVRDCIKCHDPHTVRQQESVAESRRPARQRQNLCLNCHNAGIMFRRRAAATPRSIWDATPATPPTRLGEAGKQRIRLSPDQERSGALPRLPRCRKMPSLHKAHHDQPFGNGRTAPVPRSAPVGSSRS